MIHPLFYWPLQSPPKGWTCAKVLKLPQPTPKEGNVQKHNSRPKPLRMEGMFKCLVDYRPKIIVWGVILTEIYFYLPFQGNRTVTRTVPAVEK